MATNKDAPFGMRAIGKVGQNNDNQGLSEYNIAASAPAIFQNDAVKAINTATIAQAATAIGLGPAPADPDFPIRTRLPHADVDPGGNRLVR